MGVDGDDVLDLLAAAAEAVRDAIAPLVVRYGARPDRSSDAADEADEIDEAVGTAGSDEDEGTLGEGDVDGGSPAEPPDSVSARLPFAERAGQLRNRLVRLV